MAPRSKRDKLKGWLSRLFSPKGEVRYTPNGPTLHATPGNVFSHAQDFSLNNPAITSVQGDHNTVTYVQGDRTLISRMMGLLSQRIIAGAAHDSSARTPPPRCHPDTRVKLIARITAWFEGQGEQELVLWITGPAGVGKSAIVQTFAESLARLKVLGASVFFSRPNRRNNPHGVFITIAYQLATRNEAYRNFVAERLSNDPELLNGDMQTQFMAFIVEPFVEKRIGFGGRRWGILLDGLDELKGEDAQCEIIQLITTFSQEHPDVPLAWIIASRPESHISSTFEDDDVRRNCWSEYIPIDSTEACEDVERFFRASFKAIQKKFRRSVPKDWPSDTDFLKLTVASSGLFVYAEVVMQFIRDPDYADPFSRFNLLLLVIDRSNAIPTQENPFIHLDALYHEILSSIPSNLWPTVKRLLCFMSAQGTISACRARQLGTLRGMSILFGLSPHVIYTCVIKCHSVLRVPDWKVSHKQPLAFLHASFSDYMKDSRRSGEFYVGSDKDADDDAGLSLLEIWNGYSGDDIGTVKPTWHQHCLQWNDKPPSKAIARFHADLFHDVTFCLSWIVANMRPESPICVQLYKVQMIKLSYCLDVDDVVQVVNSLQGTVVNTRSFLRRMPLRNLRFEHLDWKAMSPVRAYPGRSRGLSKERQLLHRPSSRSALETFVSELESLQERFPQLQVAVFGGVANQRVAAFRVPLKHDHDFMYYIIPYPQ